MEVGDLIKCTTVVEALSYRGNWSSLLGFLVLLVKEFRNRCRRKLGSNFIKVFKKNNRTAKLLILANSGRRKDEGERKPFLLS